MDCKNNLNAFIESGDYRYIDNILNEYYHVGDYGYDPEKSKDGGSGTKDHQKRLEMKNLEMYLEEKMLFGEI